MYQRVADPVTRWYRLRSVVRVLNPRRRTQTRQNRAASITAQKHVREFMQNAKDSVVYTLGLSGVAMCLAHAADRRT